jgi:hypothetical protein
LTRATTTEIALGPAGTICVYSSTATQLVVDLLGWRAPGGAQVATMGPRTLLDTSHSGALAAGSVTPLTVAAGASAASIDVGLWASTRYLTIYPCDAPRPTTSAVNAPPAGEMATNHIIVRLDGAGRFCVYTPVAAQAAIDVDAVFGGSGASQQVAAPVRKVDTRFGVGTSGPLTANAVRTVNLGLPSSVVSLQATLVSPAGPGALQVYSCSSWPGLGVRATGRNVNTAGMAVVTTNAAGQVCLRSSVATQALVDLLSWT